MTGPNINPKVKDFDFKNTLSLVNFDPVSKDFDFGQVESTPEKKRTHAWKNTINTVLTYGPEISNFFEIRPAGNDLDAMVKRVASLCELSPRESGLLFIENKKQ